ncbi:hypothetical protein AUP68_05436 [Ilyonectria robusta]
MNLSPRPSLAPWTIRAVASMLALEHHDSPYPWPVAAHQCPRDPGGPLASGPALPSHAGSLPYERCHRSPVSMTSTNLRWNDCILMLYPFNIIVDLGAY